MRDGASTLASPHPQIHWFSIINSCVTVLLLTGFLATILMRVLKNDFVKYSREDEGALSNLRLHCTCMPTITHACGSISHTRSFYKVPAANEGLVRSLMSWIMHSHISFFYAAEDQEETGWKYIHGDVFRFPPYKNVFCAFVGTGAQLFALSIFIFVLACVGIFYPYNRGGLYTALIGALD